MDKPTYQKIRNSPQTVNFGMNEVACLVFGEKRFHLTVGLNACFGVFLVSPTATVSAHIPPIPGPNIEDPKAGDKNLIAKMLEFAKAYRSNENHFADHNVALVYARFQGKAALPDKKEFIEKCLRKFKVDFPIQEYDVKAPEEPRSQEHGTAFVDGGAVNGVILYLEDKPALRVFKSSPAKVNRPSGETHHSNPTFPPPQRTSETTLGIPQQTFFSNPIFPRQNTDARNPSTVQQVTTQSLTSTGQDKSPSTANKLANQIEPTKQMRYVKSQPDGRNGDRLIEENTEQILIKAVLWEESNWQGRSILVCKQYMVWTDA